MTARCEGCAGTTLEPHLTATERMLGLGGRYEYDRCRACGCVQLRDVPADMSAFYGPGYYSLSEPDRPSTRRRAYRRLRDELLFGRLRVLGGLATPFLREEMAEQREWFRRAGVTRRSRILDVGCGVGLLLRRLVDVGFASASGVDPFIREDVHYQGRLLVRRAPLEEVSGPFDLVMLHHSLEHMAGHRETLATVASLLAPGGLCLVRIPITGSWASGEYGDRWVQLDAPRHLVLHSEASLRRVAEDAGLRVEAVVHDAKRFSVEGSELYRRDLPLGALSEHRLAGSAGRRLERQARALNRAGQGDQAAFYLRKP
ncbi:MAG: hypothetical protein JWN79_2274 [Gemmatimonadetes bacterium]|jgi:2-polyprenyl-3-methyl-5-hydroxy-6-metoxy-1,4-benzoquinol methylase|nr:hypothetical protein [Gemmatimonadota bacterium]